MRTARARPLRRSQDSEQTTAAAAPSVVGLHCSTVMGSQIIREFITCSRLTSFGYWALGLCTACWWFLTETAAKCSGRVP